MNSEQLAATARARFDHEVARKVLKEKYQAKLTFAYNGGMFRAGPEMITLLSLYGEQEVVVLDLYENPVKVHASLLLHITKERWQEQMNAWLIEHESIAQNR